MKVYFSTLFLVLYFGFGLSAQTILSGVVTDSANAPIPYATVYLSKTTVAVLANNEGAFSMNIPQDGTYEMIISCIGFKSHSQIIIAEGKNQKINVKLAEHIIVLSEILVHGKDRNRKNNLDLFKSHFIGNTTNAPFCTIKNPKDLVVYRTSNDSSLVAYSVKPITILNSALGYEIVYDLKSFSYNLHTGHLRFSGDYYFQDISNHKWKKSSINRSRLVAYYGSRMHFLRALYTGTVSQESFEICNIESDSCGVKILTDAIQEDDIRFALTIEDMSLDFPNHIMIRYVDNHPELVVLPYVFRSNTYTSIIVFSDSVQVFKNGYYPDNFNISWAGDMARDRIAEMLPYDFIPE